jgi:hypothetical protein
MTAFRPNVNLTPLRQGDLDGLCGVYSVLNALQWLLPGARNVKYLNGLFDELMGPVVRIGNVRDGGEESLIQGVHTHVRGRVKEKFDADFLLQALEDEARAHSTPDKTMEAMFDREHRGVFVFGFEGMDSHFTVARGVTGAEALLFDSWGYKTFERRKMIWGAKSKGAVDDDKIVVDPKEFYWLTIG